MTSKALPLVTIGIPTYNRADGYLKQALNSAVNQTYQNIEIIVSDNCSTDNTEGVVEGFNDSRIRYVKHNENIGANNNFNYCLEQAKGSYFLLLHDDDLIDNDFVAICMKTVNYNIDVGVIRTGTRVIDYMSNILYEIPNMVGGLSIEEFFRGWFANKTSLYLCSTLFHTERLKEIGGFKSKHNLFQDVIAEVRLAAIFGRADIQDVKASFRKHGSEGTFSAKTRNWCEDSLLLLNLICSLVPENNRETVRSEGMQFLSQMNYHFAGAIKSWINRQWAYLVIYKFFNFKYLPPNVKNLLYRNPLYTTVRAVKKYVHSLQ